MSLLTFVCDACNKTGTEHDRWFMCGACCNQVCPDCSTGHDDETRRATCNECQQVFSEEIKADRRQQEEEVSAEMRAHGVGSEA